MGTLGWALWGGHFGVGTLGWVLWGGHFGHFGVRISLCIQLWSTSDFFMFGIVVLIKGIGPRQMLKIGSEVETQSMS